MFDAKKIKQDFPILRQKIHGHPFAYLDNAATSQKPKQIIESITKYYEEYNANVHRGLYQISEKATQEYENSREVIARFIGADSKEIIFEKSATAALNHIARLLSENYLKPGDTIALSVAEHHSNIVPWQIVAKKYGYKLVFLDVDPEGRIDLVSLDKVFQDVKVVSVQYVSNVTGVIQPVAEIMQKAKEKGALVILDACQAAPHLTLNVKTLDCDFLVFSSHKMLGPTGFGVLYGKEKWLSKFEPVFGGGDMILEVHQDYFTTNELPWKFEPGTQHISGAIGTRAAIEYLEKVNRAEMMQHEKSLTEYALNKIGEVPGLAVVGPKSTEQRIGAISFTLAGIHPHDIASVLDQHGVAIRAGHHCAQPLMEFFVLPATARISLYLYNTEEDIDQAVVGLQAAVKMFS